MGKMADMKRTEQISVVQLIEELKRFEKDYPDVNVTCCIPDGTICYAVSIDQDGEGQVCIGFEEEDSGCLDVEMLIADLEMYNRSAMVCIEACGLSMTFSIFDDGSFFVYDENEECVCCDGEVIGEYEEQEYCSRGRTEEEKRMLAEKAGKEKRERRIEYGALLIITILSLCGVAYNVWAVVAASGDSLWENILYGITCLFCFMIGLLALHYDRR